jgi:protein-tyrosine phosphatase
MEPLDDVLAEDLHLIFQDGSGNKFFVGNVHCLRADVFAKLQITANVNCAPVTETKPEVEGVDLIRLSMADSIHPALDVTPFFQKAISFMDQHLPGNILINCFGGQNRSPCILAAYLIARHGFTAEKACELLKEKRDLVKIGPVYRLALTKFEQAQKHLE